MNLKLGTLYAHIGGTSALLEMRNGPASKEPHVTTTCTSVTTPIIIIRPPKRLHLIVICENLCTIMGDSTCHVYPVGIRNVLDLFRQQIDTIVNKIMFPVLDASALQAISANI